MYLIVTNIFPEILLKQDKSKECRSFPDKNISRLNISGFFLHSIGVILFRNNNGNIFTKFVSGILPKLNLLSLPGTEYKEIVK